METVSLKDQIVQTLDDMTLDQLRRVLAYTQQMKSNLPPGTPGEVLLAHMDSFQFEPGDLEEMTQAIEEGCERIDWD
ncbi:MAG: hypothetical protein JXQ72_13050 [Anaerolineae bacterium]|nr:hypothetical protein [Anaerolineae bacterium]